jgi:hypothetical protein
MADEQTAVPDGTAVRVALWRAMHVQVDTPPHAPRVLAHSVVAAARNDETQHPATSKRSLDSSAAILGTRQME